MVWALVRLEWFLPGVKGGAAVKRKYIILLFCAVLLCGAVFYAFIPREVAPQAELLEIWRVQHMDGDEDVTAQIDLAQLSTSITSCKASRLPFYQQSYSVETVQYEINGRYNGKPLHFVLGKNSFVYGSTPWVYCLHDAQALMDALDAMLASADA